MLQKHFRWTVLKLNFNFMINSNEIDFHIIFGHNSPLLGLSLVNVLFTTIYLLLPRHFKWKVWMLNLNII